MPRKGTCNSASESEERSNQHQPASSNCLHSILASPSLRQPALLHSKFFRRSNRLHSILIPLPYCIQMDRHIEVIMPSSLCWKELKTYQRFIRKEQIALPHKYHIMPNNHFKNYIYILRREHQCQATAMEKAGSRFLVSTNATSDAVGIRRRPPPVDFRGRTEFCRMLVLQKRTQTIQGFIGD